MDSAPQVLPFVHFAPLKFAPSKLSFFSTDLKTLVSEGTTYIECWMTGAALKAMLKQKDSRKAFFTQYKK